MKRLYINRWFCLLLLALAFVPAWAQAQQAGDVITARVAQVYDGDTVRLEDGKVIRLVGINTPEIAHRLPAEPYGDAAATQLRDRVLGRTVKVVVSATPHDRYHRVLGDIYLPDGTWLNRWMITTGAAHVYSFPDNRANIDTLLKAEAQARAAHKGLWALPRYQVLAATGTFPASSIGQFHLVAGKVLSVTHGRDRTYLNFGPNWRTDFTAEIPDTALPLFKAAGLTPLTRYTIRQVLVHGRLKPVNGTLITVTHPEQLEFTDPSKTTQP